MMRAVSDVPVIVVTARDDDADIVRALDAGADDYVAKPFGADHLEARIRAVLRRSGRRARGAPITVGDLVVDAADPRGARSTGGRSSSPAGVRPAARTSPQRAGEVVSKRELLAEVWRQPYGGGDRTVDVHLSWLRRKLGETRRGAALPAQHRGASACGSPPPPAPEVRPTCAHGVDAARRGHHLGRVVAFLVPLALLLRTLAEDRAIAAATAAGPDPARRGGDGTGPRGDRTAAAIERLVGTAGR